MQNKDRVQTTGARKQKCQVIGKVPPPPDSFKDGGGQQKNKAPADNNKKNESTVSDPNEAVCFNCDRP